MIGTYYNVRLNTRHPNILIYGQQRSQELNQSSKKHVKPVRKHFVKGETIKKLTEQ